MDILSVYSRFANRKTSFLIAIAYRKNAYSRRFAGMITAMSDILADYRIWKSQQEERIGTHSKRCHLWPRHERCMIHRLAAALTATRDELASATRHMEMAEAAWLRETAGNSPAAVVLTDEEREAIAWAVSAAEDCQHPADDTLRGLLERLG